MSWRPKKRITPSGKTVWVARFKDDRGRVRIAKPAWNGGKGTFELKREAQHAIESSSGFQSTHPRLASTSTGGWRRIRGRSAPIEPTPAVSATYWQRSVHTSCASGPSTRCTRSLPTQADFSR
jgi:hypothetical protein